MQCLLLQHHSRNLGATNATVDETVLRMYLRVSLHAFPIGTRPWRPCHLGAKPDLTLVGEAADGDKARRLSQEHNPDVLLLDLNMPGPSAFETVAFLREHCPQVKVVMLTAYVRGLVAAGVAGYVLKDEIEEAVVRAIRTVMQGDTWFSGRSWKRWPGQRPPKCRRQRNLP